MPGEFQIEGNVLIKYEGRDAIISIPEGITQIAKHAFYDKKTLTKLIIPASVTTIDSDAFEGCKNLAEITVESGNTNYSSEDGILYNAKKDSLLYCPGGKNLKEFIVDEGVISVGDHAFHDCLELEKVVIPASVKRIGREAFFTYYMPTSNLTNIQVAIGAGSEFVGENIFDFPYGVDPLTYPTIPVTFPKERRIQVRLALGFCQSPEQFTEEYAAEYRKYVQAHHRTLLKKATSMKLQKVIEYLNKNNPASGKIEIINYKKLSKTEKVELLETAVLENNIPRLQQLIENCKPFEFTARALGLACLYGNVEMVKLLVESGATFNFDYTPALKRKYGAGYSSRTSSYPANYSLMISCTEKDPYIPTIYTNAKEWHLGKLPTSVPSPTNAETRATIAEYLLSQECGFKGNDALYYAILWGCLPVAKQLIKAGVKLSGIYAKALCESATIPERSELWITLCELSPSFCAERLNLLASCLEDGNQIILTQSVFETENTPFLHADVLRIALSKTDCRKLKRSKILEMVVNQDNVATLEVLVENGWINAPIQREKLIQYATDNSKTVSLAWLMDYKNRTVDVAAEEAKAEAKMIRELMEDPTSASALKKIWSFKKLENGTLQITSYKGNSTEIVVPEKIGKSAVSSIGEGAFSSTYSQQTHKMAANHEIRNQITSVVLPEGITEIGPHAFSACKSLVSVRFPSTLKKIGSLAFGGCKSLDPPTIPAKTKQFGHGVFWGCDKLYSENFLIVNQILFHYKGDDETVTIPEGVSEIAGMAFKGNDIGLRNIKHVIIPDTVKTIGTKAFTKTALESLVIPGSVKRIEESAFEWCSRLKEVQLNPGLTTIGKRAFHYTAIQSIVIPNTVSRLGEESFDSLSLQNVSIPASVKGIGKNCFGLIKTQGALHTDESSYAEKYFKEKYPAVIIFYDYSHKDG